MSDTQQDPLQKSKWNYAAIVSLFVLVSVNIVAAVALFKGMIGWTDWVAATGSINGAALGWMSKELSAGK